MLTDDSLLSDIEKSLQERFKEEEPNLRIPSSAQDAEADARIVQLVLPVEDRPRMPYTQDRYIIRENPHLITWEREVRKFCRNLNLSTGHRISAVMIFEWATGIRIADLVAAGSPPNPELRAINKVLRHYYGKAYSTYIMGRKVPNCYRVPAGYRIKRHRPLTMTLLAEYHEGVLNP